MNSFLWGQGRTSRCGINCLTWEKLWIHKTQGGISFKDLSAFNLAMLGKQGWKFKMEPESLVSRIFKVLYFLNNSYLMATIEHNLSYLRRNILHARFIIWGTRWSIGSGNRIPILDEPWFLNGERIHDNIPGALFVCNASINSLLDPYFKRRNEPVARQFFSENLASKIINTPLFE